MVCPGFGLDNLYFPGHALREKGSQRQIDAGTLAQQPGTKSGRNAADKLRVKRGVCSPIGSNGVSFVRASRGTPRSVFFDRLGNKKAAYFLGEPTRRRPVLPVPAPPRRPAVRRPVPNRPLHIRVLGSTSVA